MQVICKHWTVGGTGITNFDIEDIEIFEKACKEFNDPETFVVKQPCISNDFQENSINYLFENYYSLHSSQRDLSEFWKIQRRIKTNIEDDSILDVEEINA